MKKTKVGFVLCAFLLFLLAGTANAQLRFGFRAYGGLSYLTTGDVNKGAEGWSNFYKSFELLAYTTSDKFQPLNLGFDFGGELIIQFSPMFGVGLGGGYITASKTFTMNYTSPVWDPVTYTSETTMGAIPLRLTLYCFLPISPAMNITFHAGAGYYLASLNYHHHAADPSYWEDRKFDATGSNVGFHGGLGLEVVLSPAVSLAFDLTGRLVSISNFEGDYTFATTWLSSSITNADLYFVRLYFWPYGYFNLLVLSDTTPSDPEITEVRRANVDLSGLTFHAGFIFRF